MPGKNRSIEKIKSAFDQRSSPVQFIRGVGPKVAQLLGRKGVRTVEDLLYYLPRKYEDRRHIESIGSLTAGKVATVVGEVRKAEIRYYRKARVFEVTVDDGSGALTAKWFRGSDVYLRRAFTKGRRVILTGELRGSLFGKEMAHPDYEVIENDEDEFLHFKRIVPIYSETEGLRQKHLRRIMQQAVERYARCIASPIPQPVCQKRGLAEMGSSLRKVHFPDPDDDVALYNAWSSTAHRRLAFDDFFFFELAMAMRKKNNAFDKGISFQKKGGIHERFYDRLPFALTTAQKRVIAEIESDMAGDYPMHRLVQGDVGCGKTVVAMAALLRAAENNYQGAIMAPTEILAGQHFESVRRWSGPLSIRTGFLTGGQTAREQNETLDKIARQDVDIVVGTHALIQERVSFNRLGLAVIDEQHRFGVTQRRLLRDKGLQPDILVMTATPIPRTLALTIYGDLDISVIDEMPSGKGPVQTVVFYEDQRQKVYGYLKKELIKGHQAFVIYPLIEASEVLDLKDATRMAEHLQKEIFPDFRIGLVHGKMKTREKEKIMSDFSEKRLDILVSTTVVEVGIDIPSATLMVIEHAERFGLSQLHQLRGRVGRRDVPSRCILLASVSGSDVSARRLRMMEKTNDGFRIAEEDLRIRGPGEFLGTRQSGLPDFRVASILRDEKILMEAREDAFAIVNRDPRLERPEHRLLKEVLMERWGDRLPFAKTG